jgi:hypothetical protein
MRRRHVDRRTISEARLEPKATYGAARPRCHKADAVGRRHDRIEVGKGCHPGQVGEGILSQVERRLDVERHANNHTERAEPDHHTVEACGAAMNFNEIAGCGDKRQSCNRG